VIGYDWSRGSRFRGSGADGVAKTTDERNADSYEKDISGDRTVIAVRRSRCVCLLGA